MQIYFPNFKSKQGCIGIFDYLLASQESQERNVIYNSDLNVEYLSHLPGGTQAIDDTNLSVTDDWYSFLGYVVENFNKSNAQLFQDLYVLWKLKSKTNGKFVEIGTGYPTGLNNTWTMESQLGWSGALVEPNPFFHRLIQISRSSQLETKAIYTQSGMSIKMNIPNNFHPGAGITINHEIKVGEVINELQQITVQTISLIDFLEKYQISLEFDYLSYDTTGNVFDIQNIKQMLEHGYRPKTITVGHNYKSHRPALFEMLQLFGYIRQFEHLSKWDDWYYHTSLKEN